MFNRKSAADSMCQVVATKREQQHEHEQEHEGPQQEEQEETKHDGKGMRKENDEHGQQRGREEKERAASSSVRTQKYARGRRGASVGRTAKKRDQAL